MISPGHEEIHWNIQEKRGGKKDDNKDWTFDPRCSTCAAWSFWLLGDDVLAMNAMSFKLKKQVQIVICLWLIVIYEEGGKSDTDKLLDAVEAKMRVCSLDRS